MCNRICDHEEEVLDAVASGSLDGSRGDELRQHLSVCQECADLALVSGLLQRENELALQEVSLPSASFLWWKSKLRARRESEERAMQPVLVAEKIAMAAGAIALGGLGWWLWPSATLLVNSTLALGTGAALVSLMGFAVYAVVAKN